VRDLSLRQLLPHVRWLHVSSRPPPPLDRTRLKDLSSPDRIRQKVKAKQGIPRKPPDFFFFFFFFFHT
jgi:hypothetical protein